MGQRRKPRAKRWPRFRRHAVSAICAFAFVIGTVAIFDLAIDIESIPVRKTAQQPGVVPTQVARALLGRASTAFQPDTGSIMLQAIDLYRTDPQLDTHDPRAVDLHDQLKKHGYQLGNSNKDTLLLRRQASRQPSDEDELVSISPKDGRLLSIEAVSSAGTRVICKFASEELTLQSLQKRVKATDEASDKLTELPKGCSLLKPA